MSIKFNFKKSGTGISLSPGVGLPTMMCSAGNRRNFAARLLGKIAERLIDYNRLFGSLPGKLPLVS